MPSMNLEFVKSEDKNMEQKIKIIILQNFNLKLVVKTYFNTLVIFFYLNISPLVFILQIYVKIYVLLEMSLNHSL